MRIKVLSVDWDYFFPDPAWYDCFVAKARHPDMAEAKGIAAAYEEMIQVTRGSVHAGERG